VIRLLWLLGWLLAAPAALAAEPELSEDDWVTLDDPDDPPEKPQRTWEDTVLRKRQRMAWGGAALALAMTLTATETLDCKGSCHGSIYLLTVPMAVWGGFKLAAALGTPTRLLREQGLTGPPIAYWVGWTGVAAMTVGWWMRATSRAEDRRPWTLTAAAGASVAVTGFATQALWNTMGWYGTGHRAVLPRVRVTPWLEGRAEGRAGGLALTGRW